MTGDLCSFGFTGPLLVPENKTRDHSRLKKPLFSEVELSRRPTSRLSCSSRVPSNLNYDPPR